MSLFPRCTCDDYLAGGTHECPLHSKKQPLPDRGRPPLTGPDTSLGQTTAAQELYAGWIETYSGIQWNCLNPREQDVRLDDIAHGLALMCRFGGQVRVPYTVGQHSIYVWRALAEAFPYDYLLQMHGLMHDASEAYLSDIVRPLKHQIPQYLEIEKQTQSTILNAFSITPLTPLGEKILKSADNAVLAAEHRDLYPHSVWNWTLPDPPVPFKITPTNDWKWLEETFIESYHHLKDLCSLPSISTELV